MIEDACKPLNEKDVEPTKSVLQQALKRCGNHSTFKTTSECRSQLDWFFQAGVRVLTSSQAAEEVKQIAAAGNMEFWHCIKVISRSQEEGLVE